MQDSEHNLQDVALLFDARNYLVQLLIILDKVKQEPELYTSLDVVRMIETIEIR